MKLKKIKKAQIFIALAAMAVLFVLALLVPNVIVCAKSAKYVYEPEDIEGLPTDFDCILVLGAGLYANGTPKPMLGDRLTVACDAYKAGLSERLLMSGDHLYESYNEPKAMKNFAKEQGIDANVIFLDHAGASTYDSVYRAINIFGAKKILIVTQEYHLYRAVYIARALGAETYGVSSSLRSYTLQVKFSVREWAARVKDFLFSIVKPEAAYMGEKIDLSQPAWITD